MSGWLGNKTATIADLFAGTGGMGLASILTPQLRQRSQIIFTGEIDPDYVSVIRQNYDFYARKIGVSDQVPLSVGPTDLRKRSTLNELRAAGRHHGGLTLLLAGPPCQGFSAANLMSREQDNPLNLLSLRTIDAVEATHPKIVVIENVPGIQTMPSTRSTALSVSQHIEKRLTADGYVVQSALLDAADYGVPQRRVRSFTIAVRRSIAHNFDLENLLPAAKFGPGLALPYRTVRDAIGDLPRVGNGSADFVVPYSKLPATAFQREMRRHSPSLFDHVTTRHADYVIDRYRAIPPGGNWRHIRRRLSNYTCPDNTHTNIYHRLHPDKPSRTIGNFRKAMTIHPWEHRGLSVREAARLQSLPDWLRFFGDDAQSHRGIARGLGLRQQQVGNAVCFNLTSALIAHLFKNA